MIKRSGSKSLLFLMEQLLAILIFALCVTACMRIFVEAHETAADAHDLSCALIAAKNGVECFKATGGDMDQTMLLLDGKYVYPEATVYFDSEWKTCRYPEAAYTLRLIRQEPESSKHPLMCLLSVEKIDGSVIIDFTVAAGGISDD